MNNGKYANKSRGLAIFLSISGLGMFGFHKFYVGRFGKGTTYLLFSWTLIPGLICYYDAYQYYKNPQWFRPDTSLVDDLVDNAKHDSINENSIIKKEVSAHGSHNYTMRKSVIDYLYDAEQPHFIFQIPSSLGGISAKEEYDLRPSKNMGTNIIITSHRILIIVSNEERDKDLSVKYNEILETNLSAIRPTKNNDVRENHIILGFKTKGNLFRIRKKHDLSINKFKKAKNYIDNKVNPQFESEKIDVENEPEIDNEYKASIYVYPPESSGFDSISNRKLVDTVDSKKNTNSNLLKESVESITKIQKYNNMMSISVNNSSINVGDGKLSIEFDSIVGFDHFKKSVVIEGSKLPKVNYLRIISATYTCPFCQQYRGDKKSVHRHVLESNDGEHDSEFKLDEKERQLRYVYLVGRPVSLRRRSSGNTGHTIIKKIVEYPSVTENDFEHIISILGNECDFIDDSITIINDWVEQNGMLEILGVTEGGQSIHGGISGSIQSSGSSKDIQIGPFSQGKTESQGSINASITSSISDNSYQKDVEFFKIDKHGIYVYSDPILDIFYSDIDRVINRKKGILLEIGQNVYSISGKNKNKRAKFEFEDIDNMVSYIDRNVKSGNKNME